MRNNIVRINGQVWDDSDWNGGTDINAVMEEMRRKQEEEFKKMFDGWGE